MTALGEDVVSILGNAKRDALIVAPFIRTRALDMLLSSYSGRNTDHGGDTLAADRSVDGRCGSGRIRCDGIERGVPVPPVRSPCQTVCRRMIGAWSVLRM